MANYYETLLVPTDVDNEQLQKSYQQIEDSEGEWPIYPYYPMDRDFFLLAYQTLVNPVKRAAYDQENKIVPQEASFKTCLQWTEELTRETTGQGRTPGPYFAHIGIANLLNGGQIDFVNDCQIRRTHDKLLVFVTPDGGWLDPTPPFIMDLPGCQIDFDQHQNLRVWLHNEQNKDRVWEYSWNADTHEWFEKSVQASDGDQAKTKQGPTITPGPPRRVRRDLPASLGCCPVCHAFVTINRVMCWNCDTVFVRCPLCNELAVVNAEVCRGCDADLRIPRCKLCGGEIENESEPCPRCGGKE